MLTGKFASFKQSRPLQGDISADILKNENQEFKHRAEGRLIEDRTKRQVDALAEKNRKEADRRSRALEKVNVSPTGHKSHDEPLIKVLQGPGGVFDTYNDVLDQLEKDPKNSALQIKKLNLEKSVQNIRQLRDGIVLKSQNIRKGIEDGTLSPSLNRDFAVDYDKLITGFQYDYKIGDNGSITIDNKGFDPDGDGIPNEITLSDVLDPTKLGGRQKLFNVNNWVKGSAQNYGEFEGETDSEGFRTTKLKGFDPTKIDSLNQDVSVLFGEDLESMTDEAKSFIGDSLGLDFKDITEKQFSKLKSDFALKVINTFDRTRNETIDRSAKRLDEKQKNDNLLKQQKLNKDNNSLATAVAGLKAGDLTSVEAFNGRLGTTGNISIRNSEYTDGHLVFNVVDGKDKDNPKQVDIDTSKKGADGEILSYLRYGQDKAKTLEDFNKGKSDKVFEKNKRTGRTNFKTNKLIDGIPTESRDAIKYLNENEFTGFKDDNPLGIANDIKAPNGKTYNVNEPAEMEDLKKYLRSPEYKNDISDEPKVGKYDNF